MKALKLEACVDTSQRAYNTPGSMQDAVEYKHK